jgi:hypothetical protein
LREDSRLSAQGENSPRRPGLPGPLPPDSGSNPFSTRYVRPGVIPFQYAAGENVGTLLRRLEGSKNWGEIVGGHGSGKSTLLAELLPALRRGGQRPALIELHDGQSYLGVHLSRFTERHQATMIVVDGYEQLGFLARLKLKWFCRRRGLGLVVTTHAPAGFPSLYRMAPSPELTVRLVEHLLGKEKHLFATQEIHEVFHKHSGDLREVLFELYDRYEARRAAAGP